MKTIHKKTALALGTALGLTAALISGNALAQAGTPIKVGFVTELTGPWTFFGTSCVAGLKFATDEINKAGGVMGRQIEVMSEDSVNPATAATKAQRIEEYLDQR